MTEELNPCPFCGGHNTTQVSHYRECLDCETFGPSDDRQFSRWNTRPIEDALRSRIKELEEALEEVGRLETERANATVRKMASIARQALNPGKEGKSK